MEELYKRLFFEPEGVADRQRRERELHVVLMSLRDSGRVVQEDLGRLYHPHNKSSEEESIFDRQTIDALWGAAVQPEDEESGRRWDALRFEDQSTMPQIERKDAATDHSRVDTFAKFTQVPPDKVQEVGDGKYYWRSPRGGITVDAECWDEALRHLDGKWWEIQWRDAVAKEMAVKNKLQMRRREPADTLAREGTVFTLKDPRTPGREAFEGRLLEDGLEYTFEEKATHVRAQIMIPTDIGIAGRQFIVWRDGHLYDAFLGARNKARKKAAREAKTKVSQLRVPQAAGDMSVKGTTKAGKLLYVWEGTEVEVTPRQLRPPLADAAGKGAQARAQETTPQRALRKMKEKLGRLRKKSAREELSRVKAIQPSWGDGGPAVGGVLVRDADIVVDGPEGVAARARDALDAETPAGGALSSTRKCPALSQLDDPTVLAHLRAAYEFLGTAERHYCRNCDEEWVIFTGQWPTAGMQSAGPKAGVCETIARSNHHRSWKDGGLCSRCADPNSTYHKMYCYDNWQHLGPRCDALSNLTWYESLLIARVHPVISVITLTATGLLAYAGHVCNYYVKVMEWFSGLPAQLRNKKWFLIRRRRSIQGTSPDSRQKKPTTANRLRLEAGAAEAVRRMPRVYEGSVCLPEEFAKFPSDGEREMLEQEESVDLDGEVRVDRLLFAAWLKFAEANRISCPCAAAVMRYALDQQGAELRGGVTAETTWELCVRSSSLPEDTWTLGTRDIAGLLVYWVDLPTGLPSELGESLYRGMEEDLRQRGKTVQTRDDEWGLKVRWIKQMIHRELDATREHEIGQADEMPMDLEVTGHTDETQQRSITKETEAEAEKLKKSIASDQDRPPSADHRPARSFMSPSTDRGPPLADGKCLRDLFTFL
jgi:hypothetical protein